MILKPFCFSWWSACISGQAAGAPAATTARHCIGEHLICATADLVSMTNGSPPASLTTRLISCALLGLLSHTTTNGRRPSDGVIVVLWVSEFECVAVKTAPHANLFASRPRLFPCPPQSAAGRGYRGAQSTLAMQNLRLPLGFPY